MEEREVMEKPIRRRSMEEGRTKETGKIKYVDLSQSESIYPFHTI